MDLLAAVPFIAVVAIALPVTLVLFASSMLLAVRPGWLGTAFGRVIDEAALWATGASVVSVLEGLGFKRLGVRTEWVTGLNLSRKHSLELASAEAGCFVSVGATLGSKKVGFYFITAFPDGAVVFTSTRIAYSPKTRADFVYGAHQGAPGEVLEVHRKRVRALVEAGHRLGRDFGPEARLAACRAYYANPEVRGRMKRAAALVGLELAAAMAAAIAFLVVALR